MPVSPAEQPDLSVSIGSVRLDNPVLTASGTCGYGTEYAPFLDLSRLGGFTTKSITVQPRLGNEPQRIVETTAGMLNAIGLANLGLEAFIRDKLPGLADMGTPVFVNVAGDRIEDYVTVCRRLNEFDQIAGFELNVSCPNVADGLTFGTNPDLLRQLMDAVRPVVTGRPLIVKLSPNVTDICQTARAAVDGGADALSMVNTFLGMAIDIDTWRPALARGSGGLSGPAIKPMAIHLVHRVYKEVACAAGIPIIGMGGIGCWRDAVEFLLAGATAVSVGTALFIDPTTPIKIIDGLSAYLARRRLKSVADIIGRAEADPDPAGAAG